MSESDALKDVRVLVSGGSGAIGSGIAIACARQGARLLLGFHHHEARAQNLARDFRGGQVLWHGHHGWVWEMKDAGAAITAAQGADGAAS